MKKLLVVLGLAACVLSANAASNSVSSKKCKTKLKHGVLRTKGNCPRPIEEVDSNTNNNNTIIVDTVSQQPQPGYYNGY